MKVRNAVSGGVLTRSLSFDAGQASQWYISRHNPKDKHVVGCNVSNGPSPTLPHNYNDNAMARAPDSILKLNPVLYVDLPTLSTLSTLSMVNSVDSVHRSVSLLLSPSSHIPEFKRADRILGCVMTGPQSSAYTTLAKACRCNTG